MQVFTAASYQDVLGLITQIAVLIFTAKLFGELALRIGQPPVVGEILAGVFWGPSFLGSFFPQLAGIVSPATPVQGYLLETVGLLGAMFLLLLTGLETDLPLIKRLARPALGAALGGIILPFITGFILGQYLIPDYLLIDPDRRMLFALFIATSMSISAIPVISKVLIELGLMRRDLGQSIIAAGMTDDTIGWILLSIVTGMAAGKEMNLMSIVTPLIVIVVFIGASFTVGKWLIKKVLNFVQDEVKSQDKILTFVVGLAFLWGAIAKFLHFEPLMGAFIVGIIVGGLPRLHYEVREKLESMALAVLSPIFFAIAGLKVNIYSLCRVDYLLITLIVVAIACFGKITGAYLGARLIGRKDHWTALGFGAALNARGAMEIIVATIGLSTGILSQEMFSIIVFMSIVTTLMAPFLLKWIFKHAQPVGEELKRLQEEKLLGQSLIARIHRILLPLRKTKKNELTTIQLFKFKILEKISNRKQLSLTVLNVASPSEKSNAKKAMNFINEIFGKQELVLKVTKNPDIASAILDEGEKGYDCIILGSTKHVKQVDFFSSIVNDVTRMSHCVTMIACVEDLPKDWQIKNILVPLNKSIASKHAAELAFMMASGSDNVTLLNVITGTSLRWFQGLYQQAIQRQTEIANDVINDIKQLSAIYNVSTNDIIEFGYDVESTILKTASKEDTDLIILGTNVKLGSKRLFLGPRVEYIIRHANCPVIILNT